MWRKLLLGSVLVIAIGSAIITFVVELEAAPAEADFGGPGPGKALVLYHPSRDARFSDELAWALAAGLKQAGLKVSIATTTSRLPEHPEGIDLLAVVANTFWSTPDLPTLRYLKRARLDGIALVGVIGGMGSTVRAERILRDRLQRTGGKLLEVRSFWTKRPNDEAITGVPNRAVARQQARAMGFRNGGKVTVPTSF